MLKLELELDKPEVMKNNTHFVFAHFESSKVVVIVGMGAVGNWLSRGLVLYPTGLGKNRVG
jgi:hypothetical protein